MEREDGGGDDREEEREGERTRKKKGDVRLGEEYRSKGREKRVKCGCCGNYWWRENSAGLN